MLLLGLPLIGSHIARMAIGVTDTLYMGRYGVDPLAALVLATSVYFLLYMLGSGYGIGVMGPLAAARARGDETDARRNTRMALWVSALHAVAMAPILYFSGAILMRLGQAPEVAAHGQEWLRVMMFGLPAQLGALTLNSFLATIGRANIVLWVTLAGIPVNAALNWMLIFGHGPFPELGVFGSAISSAAVVWTQFAVLAVMAARLPEARPYHLWQNFWRPDWQAFGRVVMLGLPIGLTLVAETGMFTGANLMMGWFGPDALAAHGIALQLASMAFMIQLGLSNASTIRIGGYHGVREIVGLRDAGTASVILSAVFGILAMCVFLAIPVTLTSLYLDNANPRAPHIIALATSLMLFAALFQIADSLQAMALGLLRGVQDTRVPMLIAVLSYWAIGLPSGYLLAIHLGLGPIGLWIGLVIGLSCAAVLLMTRFWRRGASWWQPTPGMAAPVNPV